MARLLDAAPAPQPQNALCEFVEGRGFIVEAEVALESPFAIFLPAPGEVLGDGVDLVVMLGMRKAQQLDFEGR
jgi:hypothetical protein